jgi:hypothetical protein
MDPDELAALLRAQAEAALPEDVTQSIEHRRRILVAKRMAEHAAGSGIVFGAGLTTDVGDANDPYALTALVFLSTFPSETLGADEVTFEQVRLGAEAAANDSPATPLSEPAVVEIPSGPAIRTIGMETVAERNEENLPLRVLHIRYFTVIGDGDGIAALAFLTPNVELSEEWGDLFHSIACSLEFAAA